MLSGLIKAAGYERFHHVRFPDLHRDKDPVREGAVQELHARVVNLEALRRRPVQPILADASQRNRLSLPAALIHPTPPSSGSPAKKAVPGS